MQLGPGEHAREAHVVLVAVGAVGVVEGRDALDDVGLRAQAVVAAVLGSRNSASRMGELRLASGQKFACWVPLFCIRSTSRLGGAVPRIGAQQARASGRVTGDGGERLQDTSTAVRQDESWRAPWALRIDRFEGADGKQRIGDQRSKTSVIRASWRTRWPRARRSSAGRFDLTHRVAVGLAGEAVREECGCPPAGCASSAAPLVGAVDLRRCRGACRCCRPAGRCPVVRKAPMPSNCSKPKPTPSICVWQRGAEGVRHVLVEALAGGQVLGRWDRPAGSAGGTFAGGGGGGRQSSACSRNTPARDRVPSCRSPSAPRGSRRGSGLLCADPGSSVTAWKPVPTDVRAVELPQPLIDEGLVGGEQLAQGAAAAPQYVVVEAV